MLLRALILSTVIALGLLAGTVPASAHVHVEADHSIRGQWALLTFEVPNESENGSSTTGLNIIMPANISAMVEQVPGWTVKLDRDVPAGTVRAITWTAAPGGAIPPDQFALFRVSLKLPDTPTVSFAATQTYSDGTVVRWDEAPLPDGSEPEHPAPTLTLVADMPASHRDSTSRWLAIAALVVAAGAVGLVLVRRRS